MIKFEVSKIVMLLY